MEALMLARAQFGANITFHILFPTITIALGWVLLFFKLRYNGTKDMKWMEAYRFYVKVFALCFALGVVSGITMSFQFGTNWPGFMKTVGNIAGPLLAYEVMTAFFLEATFLGIMLFGFNRVSNRVHTLATVLVAFGTTMSAFWIIVLNSWMHTPTGFEMQGGVAHATSWMKIIFNPSMPYRLTHMLLASGLTTSFLIAGLSAYQWLRGDKRTAVMAAMKTGVYAAAMLIPLQIMAGDMHGLNTLEHQPQKIAAIEGIWETERGVPMLLFAVPNKETRSNDYEIGIPKLASLILTHDLDGEIKGLNEFEHHPPVTPVFYAFRIMVGTGFLMLMVSWLAGIQLFRKGEPKRLLAYALVGMTFAGWVATISGWYTTEIGRQPYLVYGVLTTAQAAADNVTAGMIGTTLVAYIITYITLIAAFISTIFYLARKAGETPDRLDSASILNPSGVVGSRQILEGGV
ncbi:MAG: cytochrome ubiquinol oxidase subunit I [Alphaproteobacteria bacterium]